MAVWLLITDRFVSHCTCKIELKAGILACTLNTLHHMLKPVIIISNTEP